MDLSVGQIFVSEVAGTGMLLLLGCGVVANVVLAKTKGNGGGGGGAWILINVGWGFAVMSGVFVGASSGAHINPAVTFGLLAAGEAFTAGEFAAYLGGQMVGAFVGASLAWLAYKDHFEATEDPGLKLAVFSTGPEIRNPAMNVITEVIGTFVLVFVILQFGRSPNELGPVAVAFLVLGIGASLGGPTGYAINPARDLGPRIAHAVLPIKGKGDSDWGYSWVPVIGPIIGGVIAGLLDQAYGGFIPI
ncbi:MAG: aquaporin family protein [Nitriliruptor sp.]|nr:MAG: aquaporin family protein [Nitriliruptor sp.]